MNSGDFLGKYGKSSRQQNWDKPHIGIGESSKKREKLIQGNGTFAEFIQNACITGKLNYFKTYRNLKFPF